MEIPDSVLALFRVKRTSKFMLRLAKSAYGPKQAGRLWSQLLHNHLLAAGFTQAISDMCLYFKHDGSDMVVVGVYVDDLLATATREELVDKFFEDMAALSIKNLGYLSRFLGMRVHYDDHHVYELDQEVAIDELLHKFGMQNVHGERAPIGEECNDNPELQEELTTRCGQK
ncbi:hypothetical protein PR001_g4168 [Phytophthora rubi]|uniref:Reverse transcriptase Ty1/copia-type domain-containing protein n=1 Tax=Phytophthora rubi TaxID=129364 RepID=A0A6A3NXV2_9STRA|nr:hypothetical protein PR001_g4168 [Phytophthora rubi]